MKFAILIPKQRGGSHSTQIKYASKKQSKATFEKKWVGESLYGLSMLTLMSFTLEPPTPLKIKSGADANLDVDSHPSTLGSGHHGFQPFINGHDRSTGHR